MTTKVTVFLSQEEYNALFELAMKELRTIPDEIHYIIQKELERQRLLSKEGGKDGN